MRMAIKEAKKSQESLLCGVVIVRDDKVLAITHNSHFMEKECMSELYSHF